MAENSVYGRLKRLFSTNTIVRNVGGKRLRIADTDNIQSFINRRGIDRFHRVYQSSTGGYGSHHGRYEAAAAFQGARLQLFRDYDMMDNDSIISSVLDIYADESTVKDEFGRVLNIKTDNKNIQEILHNLFYDVLNIEFNLWPWIRNVAKYGDFFLYLDIDPEYGIVNVIPLSIYETIRVEGEEPGNPFSVRFSIQNDFLQIGKKEFDNYEIAHFRLLSDTNFLPYGKAMIEGGRRVWKQLQLMEDAMLVHRIMRAPDKRKFKLMIGNLPPHEIEQYMQKIINKTKRSPLIDPNTGDYNLRFNMMNITEDFYLPMRSKDDGTDIETLSGLQFNAIEDIEYLRKKLLAAFKVPKSFIGYEEDINGKATLASQDVRFARTIERIQKIMVSELTKIAIIHLYVQGFTDDQLVNFELSLTNPSTLYELERINIWKEKFGLAQQMTGNAALLLSQDWVYKTILGLSEEAIKEEREKIKVDLKQEQDRMALTQPELDPNADPNADPAAGGEVAPQDPGSDAESEEQIDDVDQILNNLDNLGGEEEEESELDEATLKKKVGRPKKGHTVGTDKHPLGRDPFGHKEVRSALKRSLSDNTIRSLQKISSVMGSTVELKDYKQILTEAELIHDDGESND